MLVPGRVNIFSVPPMWSLWLCGGGSIYKTNHHEEGTGNTKAARRNPLEIAEDTTSFCGHLLEMMSARCSEL